MTDYRGLLSALVGAGVEFIVVGGMAAVLHGSARSTNDVGVVYKRQRPNLDRLVAALSPLHPRLRGAPPDLPFRFDAETIRRGLNFTFTTNLGDIDLLGEMTGVGGCDETLPHSLLVEVMDVSCRCVDLDTLIKAKRAAGRQKDFEAVAELEAIRDRTQRKPQ